MKCITYNVRGLTDKTKRQDVFCYLRKQKCDIIMLQETHSTKHTEKYWSTQWGSKIRMDHGETNARGVAIMFTNKVNVQIHNVILSEIGCYIILYATLNGNCKVVLANIYAPNHDDPGFFKSVFHEIHRFSPDYFIVGGDFNLALDSCLDRMGTKINNDKAASCLNDHFDSTDLVDVWRNLNPDQNGYTWRRLNPLAFSRLDYFITSESFLQFVRNIEVLPGFRTDHSIVCMQLHFQMHQRGPGYWKLNLNLLRDHDYITRINELIDIELALNQNRSWKEK